MKFKYTRVGKARKASLRAIKRFKSIQKAAIALGKERTTLHSLISRLGLREQVDTILGMNSDTNKEKILRASNRAN